jgi:hypothetical protein
MRKASRLVMLIWIIVGGHLIRTVLRGIDAEAFERDAGGIPPTPKAVSSC